MLPPMFLPDLRVEPRPDPGLRPLEGRTPLRRGLPAPLRLAPSLPIGPHVAPALALRPRRGPSGRVGRPSGLRLRLGLLLIVWGRRLAGPRAR